MKSVRTASYGTWKSPITAELVSQQSLIVNRPPQIVLDGTDVYWLELRPSEQGRTVIVRRSADGAKTDVTPPAFNVRTRVHEYGGAPFLVDRGTISQAEVRTHPQRNYILRNVGDKPQLQVDLYEAALEPGQSLLLCCDGLWEMVLDEQIRDIVNQHANPQDACRELIQVANENGGDDNITCVIVRLENASL